MHQQLKRGRHGIAQGGAPGRELDLAGAYDADFTAGDEVLQRLPRFFIRERGEHDVTIAVEGKPAAEQVAGFHLLEFSAKGDPLAVVVAGRTWTIEPGPSFQDHGSSDL